MHSIKDYDVYIFDCDGVILDSNHLKIEAMQQALESRFSEQEQVAECVTYFSNNFGKSRFHHVDVFVNNILRIPEAKIEVTKAHILDDYSQACKKLYLTAHITPGFIEFIQQLNGNTYIASGSEQQELRDIFRQRGLDRYFTDIFGSPTSKAELIHTILNKEGHKNAIMFGDAESDLTSAIKNEIDFIFYAPFSTVKTRMLELCAEHQHPVINDFSQAIPQ